MSSASHPTAWACRFQSATSAMSSLPPLIFWSRSCVATFMRVLAGRGREIIPLLATRGGERLAPASPAFVLFEKMCRIRPGSRASEPRRSARPARRQSRHRVVSAPASLGRRCRLPSGSCATCLVSSDPTRPSAQNTALGIRQWVCRSGSPGEPFLSRQLGTSPAALAEISRAGRCGA